MSGLFSKSAAIVAHKTLKLTTSGGNAFKNFIADVRHDMDVLYADEELKKKAAEFDEKLQERAMEFLNGVPDERTR